MSKDLAPKLVTLLAVLGALGLAIGRKVSTLPASAAVKTPQDTIYAMLDAARAGNSRAYVSFYTGQMEASLKQTLIEKGATGFASYLKSGNAEIKGVAVHEPKTVSAGEVQVRVEYIYQDRNEAQTLFLEKRADGWKIARVDNEERLKTLIPYGTPVQ